MLQNFKDKESMTIGNTKIYKLHCCGPGNLVYRCILGQYYAHVPSIKLNATIPPTAIHNAPVLRNSRLPETIPAY